MSLPSIVFRTALAGLLLAGLVGCQTILPRTGAGENPFARIELVYEGCSCFEEVRELKLISWRLFGALPEIDEDHQTVKLTLREPKPLPLQEFADAVDGTHALTRGLRLEVTARIQRDQAVIQGTGQAIALERTAPDCPDSQWCRFRATQWGDRSSFRMAWFR
jgi:hypothetical protein